MEVIDAGNPGCRKDRLAEWQINRRWLTVAEALIKCQSFARWSSSGEWPRK